jgi:hypothetical protein
VTRERNNGPREKERDGGVSMKEDRKTRGTKEACKEKSERWWCEEGRREE